MTRKYKYFIALTAIVMVIVFGHFTIKHGRLLAHYSPEIESVLKMAGSNHWQLVKVLKHYGKNPADSLKFRAAEFLIVNMPGKYSEYRTGKWNDIATMNLRWTSSSNKQLVLDTYRVGELVREADVTHITAKYLINNIELAFMVWQEMPWGKDIPFDVFCEEILPHRVGTEPLENWREKVLASFADIYISFKNDTSITSVEACCKVNDLLPRFRMDKDFHSMNYSQLMASNRGLCDEMAMLGIFAMRGLGIPVTFDFTPMWAYGTIGHSRNSVRDSKGVHRSFLATESNPQVSNTSSLLYKAARVYRYFYGRQQNVRRENIPPLLHNLNNIVDITSEFGGFDIWFPIPNDYSVQRGPVFLAVLNNEMAWQPIACGVVNEFSLEFRSIKDGLYLPVYYCDGIQTPLGPPFRYQYKSCCFYPAAFLNSTMSFTSIAPGNYEWLHRMRGGTFEVANKIDFSDARSIHTIKDIDLGYNTISVGNIYAYRYIRYVSPIGERCNISILEFYDENNEILKGTAIGTPETSAITTSDKVFDGDVDTYFDSTANPSWVGLDLGKPRKITKIRYMPRTNGNLIYEGHVYELFYWKGNEWKSLGRKTADSHILHYQAPDYALFFLKNVTKNRRHNRPFTIESGAQRWF